MGLFDLFNSQPQHKVRHYNFKEVDPNWHRGLTQNDLHDYAIIIPGPPKIFQTIYEGTHGGIASFMHVTGMNEIPPHVREGSWIHEGQQLSGTIQAPFSGKVLYAGGFERDWDSGTNWTEIRENGFKSRLENTSLAIIQPLNTVYIDNSYFMNSLFHRKIQEAIDCLHIMDRIRDKDIAHKFYPFFRDDETPEEGKRAIRGYTHEAINAIKSAKARFIAPIPFDQIPEYPSQEWIAHFAPEAGLEYVSAPSGYEEEMAPPGS